MIDTPPRCHDKKKRVQPQSGPLMFSIGCASPPPTQEIAPAVWPEATLYVKIKNKAVLDQVILSVSIVSPTLLADGR